MSFPIQFLEPHHRIPSLERRSKLLDPASALYQELERLRTELVQTHGSKVGDKRMDYHIEVIGRNDSADEHTFITRVGSLQNQPISTSSLQRMGRALVVPGPPCVGYGPTHITVAFFPGGVPNSL